MAKKIVLWDWYASDGQMSYMLTTQFGKWCEWKDAKAIIDELTDALVASYKANAELGAKLVAMEDANTLLRLKIEEIHVCEGGVTLEGMIKDADERLEAEWM